MDAAHELATDVELEQRRMDAVRRYDILDTPPDGAFDRISGLAARLLQVPIATVTIVDEDRIWFKSTHGIDVDQIDREPGLCASAVLGDDTYIVTNATDDPRTLSNSLVRESLGLRFYVGVPLRTHDGYRLGTLNVIDTEPREIRADDVATLEDLAAVVVDELELRLAARRTIELEAALRAERLRDTIIAGISHDMRTPLGVLRGLSALADDDDFPADALRRQVGHLDWLISQFIQFTALERGVMPAINLAPVRVYDTVSDAVDVVSGRLDITWERPDGAGPLVVADEDRTRQVLIELLQNAARFGATQATVTVQVDDTRDAVRVEVCDNGAGIDAADHERIFDRFFRGETSPGTGIGLYVSRTIARGQGGDLTLASSVGSGSTFTVALARG